MFLLYTYKFTHQNNVSLEISKIIKRLFKTPEKLVSNRACEATPIKMPEYTTLEIKRIPV
jgi:hypothetical protein